MKKNNNRRVGYYVYGGSFDNDLEETIKDIDSIHNLKDNRLFSSMSVALETLAWESGAHWGPDRPVEVAIKSIEYDMRLDHYVYKVYNGNEFVGNIIEIDNFEIAENVKPRRGSRINNLVYGGAIIGAMMGLYMLSNIITVF